MFPVRIPNMNNMTRWIIKEPITEAFSNEFPELPHLVKQLLANRGITTQAAIDEFLNPDYSVDVHDPYLFRDMRKAVDRIFHAIDTGEKVMIHGDYDADGVSASVILTVTIRVLGGKTDIFLPHRETDGYGLNERTVRGFHDQGIHLVITCDCGISNVKEIELGNTLGIDTIITDHHQEPIDHLPPAYATIHPKIAGETYPDKTLAGGGVAFKLAQALLLEHQRRGGVLKNNQAHEAFEKWLLDMVAISSVADMVPLLGETRTLVRYGLVVLNKTKRLGLRKLMQCARLLPMNGERRRTPFSPQDIGFRIAPRINAAGRMNHANVAFKLLIEENPDDIDRLAAELEENNIDRQRLTEELVIQAQKQVKDTQQEEASAIFILGEGWSTGIVGLIASKIKDVFYRPTFVMGLNHDEITGSGRSVSEVDMIKLLQSMPHFFTKFGGHPQACGFTLTSPDVLEEFKTAFRAAVEQQLRETKLESVITIDVEVDLGHINWNLFEILDKFQPFGVGNTEPRYLARGLIVHSAEPVGADGQHMRLNVTRNSAVVRKTIGFNCGEWCKELKAGDKIDLVFEVGVNEWNGTRELQLKIVDLKKL